MYRKPELWEEINDIIANVDAAQFKTKISKEKGMHGRMLYAPIEMNKVMDPVFAVNSRRWGVSIADSVSRRWGVSIADSVSRRWGVSIADSVSRA